MSKHIFKSIEELLDYMYNNTCHEMFTNPLNNLLYVFFTIGNGFEFEKNGDFYYLTIPINDKETLKPKDIKILISEKKRICVKLNEVIKSSFNRRNKENLNSTRLFVKNIVLYLKIVKNELKNIENKIKIYSIYELRDINFDINNPFYKMFEDCVDGKYLKFNLSRLLFKFKEKDFVINEEYKNGFKIFIDKFYENNELMAT